MLKIFCLLLISALTLLFLWIKHHYSYWARNNVQFIKPVPVVGNIADILTMKKGFPEQMWHFYRQCSAPLVGIYMATRHALLLRDLELIKRVMIKDFHLFSNLSVTLDSHSDPLGDNNLFFLRNPKWRLVRNKLSPVFSSGKLKQMFPLMVTVSQSSNGEF